MPHQQVRQPVRERHVLHRPMLRNALTRRFFRRARADAGERLGERGAQRVLRAPRRAWSAARPPRPGWGGRRRASWRSRAARAASRATAGRGQATRGWLIRPPLRRSSGPRLERLEAGVAKRPSPSLSRLLSSPRMKLHGGQPVAYPARVRLASSRVREGRGEPLRGRGPTAGDSGPRGREWTEHDGWSGGSHACAPMVVAVYVQQHLQ
jgi:hypothetical protein